MSNFWNNLTENGKAAVYTISVIVGILAYVLADQWLATRGTSIEAGSKKVEALAESANKIMDSATEARDKMRALTATGETE